MTPERWQRIEELFQEARKRATAGERAAFLDGACGDDADLRARVEALLRAEDAAGSFINTSAVKLAAGMIAADRVADMQGKTIAHYKILSAIGAGGMGEVYLAADTRSGRHVALKLLPDHLTKDADRVRRFQQEARAVLALNHPNIVTVYEIGQGEGTQFIASEFVKGETLRARLAGAPLKISEALDVATQVAAALAEAHQEGVIHRDIKPENIMLRPDGYVKVLDFGIAKLTEGPQSMETEAPTLLKVQTQPGMVLGSAHYMSPEQARGLAVDERTDIWSLGVVLYEMIAGRVPFGGETSSDCIAAILEKEPPALARYVHDVPESLDVIVTTALTKDRDERYHSAKQLLGALRRLRQRLDASAEIERSQAPQSSGFSTTTTSGQAAARVSSEASQTQPITHSTSSAEYIATTIQRHKTGAVVMLALLLIVLVGGCFGLYKLLTQSKPTVPAPKFTALTTGGRAADQLIDGLVTISPDGKYVTYAALDEHSQSSLWVKQISTNNQVQLVPPAPCYYAGTTFSPDGEFVYYVRKLADEINPTLYRIPVIGGEPVKVLDNVWSTVGFSPDGKRFAFVRNELAGREEGHKLMLANTDGSGEPSVLTEVKPPQFFPEETAPSWSPDGKLIAIALETKAGLITHTVVGASAADGKLSPLTSQTWPDMGRVLWLPDGSGLIFTASPSQNSTEAQVWYLSYPEGKARRITNDLNGYGGISLGVTADGKTIATIQYHTTGRVWVLAPNEDESHAKQLTNGTVDGADSLSWLPDGRIVYNARTGDNADLWVVNADGTNRRQLTNDAYWEFDGKASPDGRYIVFVSERGGSLNLWRIDADSNNPKQLTEGSGVDDRPAFSPDGRWVVFMSTRSGKPTAWKVSIQGGAAQQLTEEHTYVPAVSPDGRLLSYGHLVEQPGAPPRPELVLIPFDGGPPVKRIAVPGFAVPGRGGFQWTPDGRAVCFAGVRDNIFNIWALPLDGSPPRQLTNFKSEFIRNYAFSRDGRRLAVSRGLEINDIVLIKDFR